MSCAQSSIIINGEVYINGEKLPPVPGKHHSSNITTINNKVYVNGYEYKNGQWKRTLAALWHYWF